MATGLLSVASFISGIFSNLFGTTKKDVDIANYTIEQMIDVVDDDDIVTEEMLDIMMIDRDSLKKLLKGVQKANTTSDSREVKVQQKHSYIEKTEKVDADTGEPVLDSNGNPVITRTRKVDYDSYRTVTVSNERYESTYKMDWQPLYVFAVMRVLNTYGANTNTGGEISDDLDSEELQQAADQAKDEYEQSKSDSNSQEKEGDKVTDPNAPVSIDGGVVTTGVLSSFTGQYNPETKWDDIFEEAAVQTNLPVGLIKAVAWIESRFDPNAVSNKGAKGLMQLLPTGAGYGMTDAELLDPKINIMKASKYLASVIQKFDNDVIKGLCGYNHGEYYGPLLNDTLAVSDYKYSALVLNTYFGDIGLTTEKLATGKFDLFINANGGLGKYDQDTGRLQLSDLDVDVLIADFKTKFVYIDDVVTSTTDSYSFTEAQNMPNGGQQTSGDVNSEDGLYVWYVPRSTLSQVMLPYMDIYFSDDGAKSYSMNNERWFSLMDFYWASEYYDGDWLKQLVEVLPRGSEAIGNYTYYTGLTNGEVQTSGNIATVLSGSMIGYYNPTNGITDDLADDYIKEYGKNKNWHISKQDLKLIGMTDSQMWKVLTGIETAKKPAYGTITEKGIYTRMTRITVPIWVWKSDDPNNYKKKASKKTLTVNNALAYTFLHIFQDIYEDKSKPVFDPSEMSAYHFKISTGSQDKAVKTYSAHAFGVAIDLNWSTSVGKYHHGFRKQRQTTLPTKAEWEKLPKSKAKYQLFYIDCPVACVFKAYGFTWGNDWIDIKDAMHFSKVGDKNQDAGKKNHTKYFN